MQSSLQTEVILCPNCREEVPKTLYCLNCGYPLYKEELREPEAEEEDVVVEVAQEPFSVEPLIKAAAGEHSNEADEATVTPVISEDVDVEAELEPAFEAMEEVEVVESPVSEGAEELDETLVEEASDEEEAVETVVIDEDIEVREPEEIEVIGVVREVVEVSEEPFAEEPVMHGDVEVIEPEEPEIIYAVEDIKKALEEIAVEEPVIEVVEPFAYFEPDPVIREVMENFAKNISMKIRLMDLLRDGGVKAETFERLFESYVARGELLMNGRNETLERVRFDLDSRERALNEARIGLEELGIRRAIGDVSEEEYQAKSPGFEWDIRQYKDDVERKKEEIAYLGDLARVMSAEEIDELRIQGEKGYDAIDGLADSGVVGAEIASRVKVTLEEALSCLKSSCSNVQ